MLCLLAPQCAAYGLLVFSPLLFFSFLVVSVLFNCDTLCCRTTELLILRAQGCQVAWRFMKALCCVMFVLYWDDMIRAIDRYIAAAPIAAAWFACYQGPARPSITAEADFWTSSFATTNSTGSCCILDLP